MATPNLEKQKESHIERTAREPRQKNLLQVRLSHISQVNEHVRLLRLELTSGPVRFLPGQWLDTFVPGASKPGGFTIASPPSAAQRNHLPYLELAVQESPENPPAAWLWRPADQIIGSTLRVRIGGSFVFPPKGLNLANIRKVILVAGGVGVNPLMSMLSCLAETEDMRHDLDIRVLYSSKKPKTNGFSKILFLDRITSLFGQGKLKGGVRLFVTGNGTTKDTQDINGTSVEIEPRRLSMADLEAATGSEPLKSTIVYVCGPPTMTDELVSVLISPDGLAINPQHVLTEKWW